MHWDTALLLKKFDPEGESLPQARFCSLPERVYRGSPMKYELRLSDMVLQSTSKTAVRQKVDRFFTAGGGRLSVLSDYYAASNNITPAIGRPNFSGDTWATLLKP